MPIRVRTHYTHAEHAARCVDAGQGEKAFYDVKLGRVVLGRSGPSRLVAWVQVKLGHQLFCARIVRPWLTAEGHSMWSVLLQLPGGGRTAASVPAFKVRQCSGVDGYCACAREGSTDGAAGPVGGPEGVTC